MTQDDEWMTIPEAAKYLRVHHRTIRDMIAAGDVKGYRMRTRAIRLRRSDLDAFMCLTPVVNLTPKPARRPIPKRAARRSA